MISNLLDDKAHNTVLSQKNENLPRTYAPITSNLCTYTFLNQTEACTGKIESISNAASPTKEVCADQNLDSIT